MLTCAGRCRDLVFGFGWSCFDLSFYIGMCMVQHLTAGVGAAAHILFEMPEHGCFLS